MISPRRLVLLVSFLLAGVALAQQPTPSDERAARLAERYKTMLLANPVDGVAVERLWKAAEERADTAGLIDEYRRLAESPGGGSAPALIYGHLLKRAGRLDEAAASYARAATLDSASPLPRLAQAELALVRSEPEKAADLFAAALSKLPAGDRRPPEILLKLGAAWMAAGQPLKAAESWETLVARDPGNTALHRQLAETYEKNGLSERALPHYEYVEAHAEPAERAAALRDLARLHEARGEFDAARDALERGLDLTARDNWLHADLQTRLIRLYQRAGRVPELEARWRAAAASVPRDLGGPLRLEALAEAEGDVAGQRHWLEALVALAPRDREYTLRLARRLADDGERQRAAALYDDLLKTQPDSLDLILARSDLDLQLGQPAAAVNRLEARLARHPGDESAAAPALAFFLEHHLDAAAEKSLRAEVARSPAADPSLALAKFLFARRKGPEAQAALAALTREPGTDAARAERWTRSAEILREQNLPTETLQAWQEAARLQPRSAAPLLAAGEFLLARGNKAAAAEQFERAAALTSGPEEVEVEHRLFGVLQSMNDSQEEGDSPEVIVPSLADGARPVRNDQPLGRRLAALEKVVAAEPTAEHWLRLARWQSWAHLPELAFASATRAVEANPADLAARELAATMAADLRRPAEAEAQWQELAARDPAHKAVYLRRLANLKMEAGDQDGAVSLLAEVQQATPGSREALTDLALAQQRAERWYDAVVTWERAYALPGTTPAQREDIRRPLLAAYERLGQFSRAAALLRAAVDEQADLSARMDLFQELAAFCRRHDLAPSLREDYEKRLVTRPEDYFLLMAVAELRREDGQEREAYALSQKAFYSSPDPARSLRELVDQAEQLGEDREAVDHQRRLIALPNQGTAANLERLAGLEDANGEEAAAARTWENIAARFPRDTAALGQAADFFQAGDQPDRARALLRQLVAIDPTDNRRILGLAALDAQTGDQEAAVAQFEQVLAGTAPEAPADALRVPAELEPSVERDRLFVAGRLGPSRLYRAARTLEPTVPGSEDSRSRLQAIEGASKLLFPKAGAGRAAVASGEAQSAWLHRWQAAAQAGARSEPLAAFYFAGQRDLTMDLLAAGLSRNDPSGEATADAFLSAGLRMGGYARLADWAWKSADRAVVADHGQRLLGALRGYLEAGGRPGPGMAAGLFPPEVRVQEVLWTAAQNGFAANHWYAEAVELGERVFAAASSARAGYGVELAEWEVYAGKPDQAREVLRQSIDDPDGDSLEAGNPVFPALRSYYLSLPEASRSEFVARFLGRPQERGSRAHGILCAVLLHGLDGDEAAAGRDLDQLLALRMMAVEPATLSPDIRRWVYLLANGEQLQAWNLSPLAVHLWRSALREAGAFDRQLGDVDNTIAEIRRRLLTAELATAADPQQARERLAEFVGETPDMSTLGNVAAQLWTDGQREAAARLYGVLSRAEPVNGDSWANLTRFYELSGDDDAEESLLGFLLDGSRALPAGGNRVEMTCRLAALREKRGDPAGALRLLEHARVAMPTSLPVLYALAATDERLDRWDAAATVWRDGLATDPGPTARLGLAEVEEHRGHLAAAIDLLRGGLKEGPDPTRPELAARLTRALLADHRPEEAGRLGFDLLNKGQFESLTAISSALATGGERTAAHDLLAAAVARGRDPSARFHLQAALIEQDDAPGEDPTMLVGQMRRLRKLAQTSATLRGEYDTLLYPLAHRRAADAWLEGEMQRAWKHGEGDPAVGVQLAGLYLQAHREDALREVVQSIDARPDLLETLLYNLATSLVESGHAPLALTVCARLADRFPQKTEYGIERALALWKSDRRPQAEQCLNDLAEAAFFRDDVLEPIATFYLAQDEKTRAAAFLQRIVDGDPSAVRSPQSWLQLAQLRLEENQVSAAGHLLRVAYARPACNDLAPLVRYLKVSGKLDGEAACRMPAPEFSLSFARRARLVAAVHDDLSQNRRAGDARRLVETHAEFLAGAPALVAELRRGATPSTVGTVAGDLEKAADQRGEVPPRLAHEMATLYTQWAGWDANDPAAADAVVTHLSRAFELEPDDFTVAALLANVCLQHHLPERAAEVLSAFLTPEALPSEREKARQILAN